ncbi:MAG: glycosyltransferase [Candidatus Eisenbacteria bacterium]|nr:glycosyltransferase [Candidatus Eisenbacteria bacterium]
MNVLHIIESPSWTGAMAQTLELMRGLKGRGHSVSLASKPGSILWDRTGEAGIERLAIETRSELNPVAASKLAAHVLRRGVDVVHAHRAHAHSLGILTAMATGCPLVVSRRVSFRPKDNLGSRLKYRTRFVTRIVAVSGAVRDVMIDYGVPAERVAVIYSGSDPTVYRDDLDGASVRRELGIPEGAPLVGKVANYYHGWKGHDTFLAAASAVAKKEPETRFLLVGHLTDGDRMRSMVREAGLSSFVTLAGYRDDVPRVLAALDVSVNCPRAGEGLSGAVRESLAAGVPVIATDVGGNRELVRDGQTGLLVEADDPDALSRAMLRLLREPALAGELARRGAEFVRENLSVERMVRETESLYREILEERGRAARPAGRGYSGE